MSVYLTAQGPAISYQQASPISLTGVAQAAVMHRFTAINGVDSPDIIGESNAFLGYRLTASAAGVLSGRWRTSTVNQGFNVATGVQPGDVLEIYTLATLDGTVEFYVNGVSVGNTLAGPAWATNAFQLLFSGAADRDYEHEELAYWVGSLPEVADITAQVSPPLHVNPPTGYFPIEGPANSHADPLANTAEANDLIQQTGAQTAPDWPYYTGQVAAVDDVDGDDNVTDGQGSATVSVSGFTQPLNDVRVTDGVRITDNLFLGGSDPTFTWQMSDWANEPSDSAVGQPDWFEGSLQLVVSDGVDSAMAPFTWNAAADWASNTINGNTTDPGSISENRGAPYPDGSSSYFPTTDSTSVDGAGQLSTSKTANFTLKAWAEDTGVVEVVTVVITPTPPPSGAGSTFPPTITISEGVAYSNGEALAEGPIYSSPDRNFTNAPNGFPIALSFAVSGANLVVDGETVTAPANLYRAPSGLMTAEPNGFPLGVFK